jgi:hypothetical protein
MITKEDYQEKIDHYKEVLSFQPNEKEKDKVKQEIEYLKERILFLINK